MDLAALHRLMPFLHPLTWLLLLTRLAAWRHWRPAPFHVGPALSDAELEALAATITFSRPPAASTPHPTHACHPGLRAAQDRDLAAAGAHAETAIPVLACGETGMTSGLKFRAASATGAAAFPTGQRRAGPDPGQPRPHPNPARSAGGSPDPAAARAGAALT